MRPDFSIADVLHAYGLPGEVVDVAPIGRAWSNRVYRLTTSEGRYAVKQLLNPWRDPHWKDWLLEAAAFELAAHRSGIAMPRPMLTTDGSVLADLPGERPSVPRREGVTVRVHEWADGEPCGDGPVSPEIAHRVGGDLARMHALDHHPGRADVFPVHDQQTIDGWDELVGRVRTGDPVLADRAADAAPVVREVGELLRDAVTDFGGQPMSHGDVDQKNLIITAGGPVLCDWDVAAPWPARQELARTAMSLAVWQHRDVARAVVAGYRAAGGDPVDIGPTDLAIDLRISLDWLGLCLERVAGLRDDGDQRRAEAVTAVPRLLAELEPRVDRVLSVRSWLAGRSSDSRH
ncbi:phosphotransferase [Microlunatus soli]|uniref:Ser/Thr protein kinase RdoA involved in Cpx stress response, MazF antagonist n=1 Tax=Microlunatus soli TaxID=630515 RepID=A0A1H1NV54_9ACTN|nr:phosphotransferase [Microlunatus soli]SDS02852.1 Ser/Thr protein kinase RdoA involved in Cpx stress response, MazF antagonist [Microlunatus soli]